MGFLVKLWQNGPAGGTRINGASLRDMEERLSSYTDAVVEAEAATREAADTAEAGARAALTGLQEPEDAVYATAVLVTNAGENGVIPMASGWRIRRIQTSRAARVRLYTTAAKRNADAARPLATDPPDYPAVGASPDHGVMFEAVTDAAHLDLPVSVDGWADADDVPIRVDNLGGAGAVNVTITYQRTEP